MKNATATKILRLATAIAALPLIVGVPYVVAWIARPSEWLNTTFGLPYAGVALLLFCAAGVLGLVGAILARRITRELLVLGVVQTSSVILGLWLLFAGPGQHISVSEVIIVNESGEALESVELNCRGYTTSLQGVGTGQRRAVAVMPKNEGPLNIRVKKANGEFLLSQVLILECAAEEFVFTISKNEIRSNKDALLPEGIEPQR